MIEEELEITSEPEHPAKIEISGVTEKYRGRMRWKVTVQGDQEEAKALVKTATKMAEKVREYTEG